MKLVNKKNQIFITRNNLIFVKYLKKIINKNDDILIIDKNLLSKNLLIKKIFDNNSQRSVVINGNEKIKNLASFSKLTEKILNIGVNRNSKIISFGGGAIGDLSGFVSSTILRGIKHIIIPTTLLSMVDSSIGGKTGINSKYGKNLIGTFYLPNSVIININLLDTLPKREISSGFAEIIKYAFIHDNKLKKILEKIEHNKITKIQLEEIIRRSICTKIKYIKDFKEQKLNKFSRAILNFGHSFGHAFEILNLNKKALKHGEAIALGMMVEMELSEQLELRPNSLRKLKIMLKKFGLRTDYTNYLFKNNLKEIIKKIKLDKKFYDNSINMILINQNHGIVKKLSLNTLNKLTLNMIK